MKKFLKILGYFFGTIIIVICSIMIFFNTTHMYYKVYGPSMKPLLNANVTMATDTEDSVFVSKIKGYSRGDVVIIDKHEKTASGEEKFVIKRIIAIGGDKVCVKLVEGEYRIVLIKDKTDQEQVLDEEYLYNYSVNHVLFTKFNDLRTKDGINFDENGFLIVGEDEIFYLGDNRLDSTDCSSYGPMPKSYVVGKVDYIIYGDNHAYLQVIKQFFGW